MIKMTVNIPDGSSCKDCPYQDDFDVAQIKIEDLSDTCPKYLRYITSNCRLFNEPIEGTTITEMGKCSSCLKKSKLETKMAVKNNNELDAKFKRLGASITQAQLGKMIGTTGQYVNRVLKKKEGIVNKTFIQMMEALGYDIELTYVKRGGK